MDANETPRYVAKKNKHRQAVILPEADANGPHIEVSWYLAGLWEGGHTSVRNGESEEQAAQRAFGKHACKTGTFSFTKVELTD